MLKILSFAHNKFAVFLWALPFLVIAGVSTAMIAYYQWKLNGAWWYAATLAIAYIVLYKGIRYIQRRFN